MTKQSSKRRMAAKQSTRSRTRDAGLATAALEAASPAVEDDLDRALEVMAAARRSLLDAEVRLRAILRDSTDDTEQAQAGTELLGVVREIELLENRRTALVSGTATLRPPSAGDIAEAQQLAGDLAQVLAANGKIVAIIGVTADIVRLTEKLVA
jgi:plasmid stability protein